jgi:hypothetical protein
VPRANIDQGDRSALAGQCELVGIEAIGGALDALLG